MMKRLHLRTFNLFTLGLLIILPCSAEQSAAPDIPLYECNFTHESIQIDGLLDEPAWSRAPAADLILWDGSGPASLRTVARMLWDQKYLYISYRVEDPQCTCTLIERDTDIHTEEVVEFFVDSSGDGIDYQEFEWNCLGNCLDLLLVKQEDGSRHFFFGWDVREMQWKVHQGEINMEGERVQGWQCEIAIPFTAIHEKSKEAPTVGDIWRINHYRIERKSTGVEYQAWSPVPGTEVGFHRPELFGKLIFK